MYSVPLCLMANIDAKFKAKAKSCLNQFLRSTTWAKRI